MANQSLLAYLRGDNFNFYLENKKFTLYKNRFYNVDYEDGHYYVHYTDFTQIKFNEVDFKSMFIINRIY